MPLFQKAQNLLLLQVSFFLHWAKRSKKNPKKTNDAFMKFKWFN